MKLAEITNYQQRARIRRLAMECAILITNDSLLTEAGLRGWLTNLVKTAKDKAIAAKDWAVKHGTAAATKGRKLAGQAAAKIPDLAGKTATGASNLAGKVGGAFMQGLHDPHYGHRYGHRYGYGYGHRGYGHRQPAETQPREPKEIRGTKKERPEVDDVYAVIMREVSKLDQTHQEPFLRKLIKLLTDKSNKLGNIQPGPNLPAPSQTKTPGKP